MGRGRRNANHRRRGGSLQYSVQLSFPGPTEGDRAYNVIRKRAEATGKTFEEMKKSYEDQIPIRRFVTPEEVAKAALFLVTEESSGMTAQHICVSGGIEVL